MVGLPEYLGKAGKADSQKLMVQARCVNMEKENRYWEEEVVSDRKDEKVVRWLEMVRKKRELVRER